MVSEQKQFSIENMSHLVDSNGEIVVCRLCLMQSSNVIHIFREIGLRLKVSSILSKHFGSLFEVTEEHDEAICTTCWMKTETFHTFYESIKNAQNCFSSDDEYCEEEIMAMAAATNSTTILTTSTTATVNNNNTNGNNGTIDDNVQYLDAEECFQELNHHHHQQQQHHQHHHHHHQDSVVVEINTLQHGQQHHHQQQQHHHHQHHQQNHIIENEHDHEMIEEEHLDGDLYETILPDVVNMNDLNMSNMVMFVQQQEHHQQQHQPQTINHHHQHHQQNNNQPHPQSIQISNPISLCTISPMGSGGSSGGGGGGGGGVVVSLNNTPNEETILLSSGEEDDEDDDGGDFKDGISPKKAAKLSLKRSGGKMNNTNLLDNSSSLINETPVAGSENPPYRMKCDQCNKAFKTFHRIQTHYRQKHNMKGYVVCCNEQFFEKDLLVDHILMHVHKRRQVKKLFCQHCDQRFYRKRYYLRHLAKDHSDITYNCKSCDRTFLTSDDCRKHSFKCNNNGNDITVISCVTTIPSNIITNTANTNLTPIKSLPTIQTTSPQQSSTPTSSLPLATLPISPPIKQITPQTNQRHQFTRDSSSIALSSPMIISTATKSGMLTPTKPILTTITQTQSPPAATVSSQTTKTILVGAKPIRIIKTTALSAAAAAKINSPTVLVEPKSGTKLINSRICVVPTTLKQLQQTRRKASSIVTPTSVQTSLPVISTNTTTNVVTVTSNVASSSSSSSNSNNTGDISGNNKTSSAISNIKYEVIEASLNDTDNNVIITNIQENINSSDGL